MSLSALSLTEAAAEIRDGRIKSAELVADCLRRIEEVDAKIEAWAHLARVRLDELRTSKLPEAAQ